MPNSGIRSASSAMDGKVCSRPATYTAPRASQAMRKMNTASSTAASVAGASAESTSTKCRVVLAPRRAQNRGVAWTAAAGPFAPRMRTT